MLSSAPPTMSDYLSMTNRVSAIFILKKHWLIVVKFLVTITLIAVLISNADWPTIFDQVHHIGVFLIVATLVILILSVTISTYKWKLFLSIHGLKYDFSRLHRYYFIAMYINNFLPTSIGGDGYRIYKTLDNERSRSSALIAVLMERVTGLAALLILAYVSAIYLFIVANDDIAKVLLIIGTISCAAIMTSYFFFPARYFRRLTNRFVCLASIIKTLSLHLGDYITHRHLTIKVVTVSFLFHFHLCLAYVVLLVFGLNLSVSIYELFIVLAVVGLIGVLPISINGLGVVEGTFIFLIGQYGVDYDDALMVALLIRLLVVPISIVGAVLFVIGESSLSDVGEASLSSVSEGRKHSDHQ